MTAGMGAILPQSAIIMNLVGVPVAFRYRATFRVAGHNELVGAVIEHQGTNNIAVRMTL